MQHYYQYLSVDYSGISSPSVWSFADLFSDITFYSSVQSLDTSVSSITKAIMRKPSPFLSIIRWQFVSYFTHIQILIPLSWNSLFDPWTSAATSSFIRPLLESAQLTVSFLTEVWRHHHNVLPLNSNTFCSGQFHLRVDWHVPVTLS